MPPNTKVVRMRNFVLGKTTIKIGNTTLSIFNRERTIVDAFRHLGRETALKALKVSLTRKADSELSSLALQEVAETAGHSRMAISFAYLGKV